MHGMNNTKMATGTWECSLPDKLFLFENGMMRIMFELKTEGMGGKGCKMWAFIICTARQILWYQRRVAKLVRNVAFMGVQLILQIVSLENWKERVHLKTCVNIRG
jgi:hypothetical protein